MKELLRNFLQLFDYKIERITDIRILKDFLRTLNPIVYKKKLIRVGKSGDSGYLIPDDLEGIKVLFSPGVSTDSTFEKEMFDKYSIISFLADFSVDEPSEKCEGFYFTKKYIGFNDENHITLEDWINNSLKLNKNFNINDDLMLQMDIEGSEYDVLMHTSIDTLKKFRILLIEFHDFHQILNKSFFKLVEALFKKLNEVYYISHIHPNNCDKCYEYKSIGIPPTLEFTFIRKDRVGDFNYSSTFPHPLDIINNPDKPDVTLPNCFLMS